MYGYYTRKRRISDIPVCDRPREKIKSKGAGALTDTELLAIFLNNGTAKNGVLKLAEEARRVIDTSSSENLFNNLLSIHGIGNAKASSICAVIEFVRRKIYPSTRKICNPGDIYPWLKPYCDEKQEHFIVITLNGANEILSRRVITIGLLNSSQVHPREVFADAVAERAASLVLAHNHPSGNCQPSEEDLRVTYKLKKSGEILGIMVLDHIVFGSSGYYSLRKEKLM